MEKTGQGTADELVPELFLRELRSAARKANHAEVDSMLATCESLRGRADFYAEALSWAARAYASREHWLTAEARATEALALAQELLAAGHVPAATAGVENSLSIAMGAGIEVTAKCHDARNDRVAATAYLRQMAEQYADASFARRIRKNLLQHSLPGQPALPLDLTPFLNQAPPPASPFGSRPVLLFCWAHWCSDSRAQARTLARFLDTPAGSAVQLVAATALFGFIAKGTPADQHDEQAHLQEVLDTEYAFLTRATSLPIPPLLLFGQQNLQRYGASTLPTLVLVDQSGTVRRYHSGQWKFEELSKAATAMLGGTS
jgi:thiol-disulfide isomerase/thioredoxin